MMSVPLRRSTERRRNVTSADVMAPPPSVVSESPPPHTRSGSVKQLGSMVSPEKALSSKSVRPKNTPAKSGSKKRKKKIKLAESRTSNFTAPEYTANESQRTTRAVRKSSTFCSESVQPTSLSTIQLSNGKSSEFEDEMLKSPYLRCLLEVLQIDVKNKHEIIKTQNQIMQHFRVLTGMSCESKTNCRRVRGSVSLAGRSGIKKFQKENLEEQAAAAKPSTKAIRMAVSAYRPEKSEIKVLYENNEEALGPIKEPSINDEDSSPFIKLKPYWQQEVRNYYDWKLFCIIKRYGNNTFKLKEKLRALERDLSNSNFFTRIKPAETQTESELPKVRKSASDTAPTNLSKYKKRGKCGGRNRDTVNEDLENSEALNESKYASLQYSRGDSDYTAREGESTIKRNKKLKSIPKDDNRGENTSSYPHKLTSSWERLITTTGKTNSNEATVKCEAKSKRRIRIRNEKLEYLKLGPK